MAIITKPAAELSVHTEVRSADIRIAALRGAAPSVTFVRQEYVVTDGGQVLAERPVATVSRIVAGEIPAESVTLASGAVLTAAQVAEAVSLFGDKWHAEDEAVAVAAAARLAAVKAAKSAAEPSDPET